MVEDTKLAKKPVEGEIVFVMPEHLKEYTLGEEQRADVMSVADRTAFFIKVTGPIEMKKLKDNFQGGLIDKSFLPIINLETGEEAMIILSKVLESIFKKLGSSAVGKSYGVQALGRGTKNYNQFKVFELRKSK